MYNMAIGYSSLKNITTGSMNIAIGSSNGQYHSVKSCKSFREFLKYNPTLVLYDEFTGWKTGSHHAK